MHRILLTLLCIALANPVFANNEGEKKNKGASNRIKAEWTIKNDALPETGTTVKDQDQSLHSVDIPVVVAPISNNGHLVNYAFLNIRVVLNSGVDVWKMRVKSHFMRDAIVRTAHIHPFGKSGEKPVVDKAQAIARIRAAILPWVSAEQIDHIEFLSIDMLNG